MVDVPLELQQPEAVVADQLAATVVVAEVAMEAAEAVDCWDSSQVVLQQTV